MGKSLAAHMGRLSPISGLLKPVTESIDKVCFPYLPTNHMQAYNKQVVSTDVVKRATELTMINQGTETQQKTVS
jgi:hypothetical protein